MSSEQTLLDENALRALMSSISTAQVRTGADDDVEQYDFTVPHRFTPDHLRRLNDFAALAARNLTAGLSAVLRGAFPISQEPLRQEYAKRITFPENAYYIALNIEGQTVGFLELPINTSVGWVTKVLGGMEDVKIEDGRILSSLETGLLLDIATKAIETFSAAGEESGGPAITHPGTVSSDPIDMGGEKADIVEFCRITFNRANSEADLSFSFVILSDVMEPIAALARPAELTAEQAREEMLGHINCVKMPLMVRLDLTEVSMRHIAALETDDVVLLETGINQPIDIIVSGRVIMAGLPVQHKENYALQVVTTAAQT